MESFERATCQLFVYFMKLQIFSDLHLEFKDFSPDLSQADIAIFAGDISPGTTGAEWLLALNADIPLLYVPGNHEYYRHVHGNLQRRIAGLTKGTNVHLLDDHYVEIGDIVFLGCTLWTDFNLLGNPPLSSLHCHGKMNDYRCIRTPPKYSRLTPANTISFHNQSREWLNSTLRQFTDHKVVVVSHHAPSALSIPEMYSQSELSAAYASNLDELIMHYQPDLWIHGHIHECKDYLIGNSRVICNPRGYRGQNNEFNEKLLIDI